MNIDAEPEYACRVVYQLHELPLADPRFRRACAAESERGNHGPLSALTNQSIKKANPNKRLKGDLVVKVNYLTLLAGATLVLLSAAATRAEESAATALATDANAVPAATAALATTASTAPVAAHSGDTATYYQDSDPVADFIARAGAWGVHASGSPTKVGEYQNLNPRPCLTAKASGATATRPSTSAPTAATTRPTTAGCTISARMSKPTWIMSDSSTNSTPTITPAATIWAKTIRPGRQGPSRQVPTARKHRLFTDNNLSPGQDFAIRVQEFKANFKGNITENLKWRLNVFGIDKEGERQVNEFQHCSAAAGNGSGPNLPGGPLPIGRHSGSCSRRQPDQPVPRDQPEPAHRLADDRNHALAGTADRLRYDAGVFAPDSDVHGERSDGRPSITTPRRLTASTRPPLRPPLPRLLTPAARQAAINNLTAGYAIVPDSQTQIDRLKFSTKIGCNTDVYLLGYAGYNEDELRDTYRNFNGADLRITNKSIDNLTLTVYGKYYREDTTSPLTALSPYAVTAVPANNFYQEPYLGSGPQINREIHTFGINGRWRPFEDQCGTLCQPAELCGRVRVQHADARERRRYAPFRRPVARSSIRRGYFTQPNSNKNTFTVGVEEKWSPKFDTFLRYKFISTEYPLYGITPDAGQLYRRVEQPLPTQENRVELGCTWTPTDCLMVNATLYVENAMSDAPYVAWTSNSLPFTVSAWWAATSGLVVLGRGRGDG